MLIRMLDHVCSNLVSSSLGSWIRTVIKGIYGRAQVFINSFLAQYSDVVLSNLNLNS
jgi:hypothetical protein